MITCLLCDRELSPREDGFFNHPEVDDCLVEYTDSFGVSVELVIPPDDEPIEEPVSGGIELILHPFVDAVVSRIFHDHGVERLGGASTGRGWSSFNLFQKCPYAWKRRYIEHAEPFIAVESPAIAVGSLVHTYLAVMYMRKINPRYPLTPDTLHERVRLECNPEYAAEAWRLFVAYRLFYQYDQFTPLAVELNLRDPRNNESCRYDLVAYFSDEAPMRLPGTYIIEHKTKQRFDRAATDGWSNDGEVLGQVELWKRLGLDKRYGPLRGVIMNIIGRQKEVQFTRTIIAPSSWQTGQHREDLKRWEGAIQLASATDNFPRARHSCIDRYGFCEWWDHCTTGS